jgi:hypothetical protein
METYNVWLPIKCAEHDQDPTILTQVRHRFSPAAVPLLIGYWRRQTGVTRNLAEWGGISDPVGWVHSPFSGELTHFGGSTLLCGGAG